MRLSSRYRLGLLCLGLAVVGEQVALTQSSASTAVLPPPATFTADQHHQNMMDELGIKALRPGPSGNESAPNHANYDESKANPYPNLPDRSHSTTARRSPLRKCGGRSADLRSLRCTKSMSTAAFPKMSRR